MNSISSGNLCGLQFNNAYMLFIAIPLLVVLTVPFFIAVRKDNRNGHNIASGVLHVLLALLIAFAAAGTSFVHIMTETEVYVVADVSYSANKNLDTIDNYIENIESTLPNGAKLGVICFGKDYKLTTKLGKQISSVKEAGVDDTETNISSALDYAGSLFHDDVIKRVVVITDGRQTYNTSSGELQRAVSNLHAQDVRVDAIFLDDTISPDAKEVQISGVQFTNVTYQGKAEEVNVLVQTSYSTKAQVSLSLNGEVLRTSYFDLSLGVNPIYFDLETEAAGTFEYEVTVSADEDEIEVNNKYRFVQTVSDDFDVLVISTKWQETTSIIESYGEGVAVEVYDGDNEVLINEKNKYISSIGEAGYNVVIHTDNLNVPYTVEDLCKYDEIVLDGIDLTTIHGGKDMHEMFLNSLNTVVSTFGKSLLTFGNMSVQDKTEGELQQLDDMLPVRFGDATSEGKLYTIVFDISYSMHMWSRLSLARQSAIQLVNTLSEKDSVCVVFFAGDIEVKLAPTKMDNKEKIISTLTNIDVQNGTLAGVALEKAMNTIINLDVYTERHVILITDGITYKGTVGGSDRDDVQVAKDSAEKMRAYGIFTTVISVGGDDGTVNREWCDEVARLGGSKHYRIVTEAQIAGVVLDDIAKDLGDSVIKQRKWIEVSKPLDPVLTGVELGGTNYVPEYVVSKGKTSATTVLKLSHDVGNIKVEVPLYAYWNYGNGRVSSYTGNFAEIKSYGGVESQYNMPFFNNIVTSATPTGKNNYPFVLSTSVDGKTARIEITPAEVHPTAPAQATVTAPDGTVKTEKFSFNYTNYYYELAMPDIGNYSVKIDYTYGGKTYTAETVLSLSYAPEYDAFDVYDASVLYKMLGGEGTVSEDGNFAVEIDENEIATYVLPLSLPFLIVCVVLFVVDIIIRKLKWNDIVSLFSKAGGKGGKK